MDEKKANMENNENKNPVSRIINKTDAVITRKIRVIIGLFLIAAAVVTDLAVAYNEDYNGFVIIIAVIGLLSIISAIFKLSYVIFMAGNIIGMLLYLFVISKYQSIGGLYVILFSILVFFTLWILEIYIIIKASILMRILMGLLVNVIVLAAMAVASVSVIMTSLLINNNW